TVCWLIEGDAVHAASIQVSDHQLDQALVTLVQHEVMLEQVDSLEHHVRPMRYDFLPVLGCEIGNGYGDQTKIVAGIIDAQIKAVTVVVDIVLNVSSTLPHQPPAAVGLVGWQVAHLTRSVAAAREQQVRAAAGEVDIHAEALVFFLIYQRISLLPQDVLPELVRALGDLVFNSVE